MKQKEKTADLDLHLAVISSVRAEQGISETMPSREIAEICGVTHQAIQHIESKALKKLRAAMYRAGLKAEDFRVLFERG